MEDVADAIQSNLSGQLSNLANQIREAEANLLRLKENYLKVEGAVEALTLLKQQTKAKEDEIEKVAEVLN